LASHEILFTPFPRQCWTGYGPVTLERSVAQQSLIYIMFYCMILSRALYSIAKLHEGDNSCDSIAILLLRSASLTLSVNKRLFNYLCDTASMRPKIWVFAD